MSDLTKTTLIEQEQLEPAQIDGIEHLDVPVRFVQITTSNAVGGPILLALDRNGVIWRRSIFAHDESRSESEWSIVSPPLVDVLESGRQDLSGYTSIRHSELLASKL